MGENTAMGVLTEGKVGKRLFFFLLPILAGNLLQQLYNSIDAVIIGRYLGAEVLGSVGVSQPIVGIVVALLVGLGTGTEILIGQAVGQGDRALMKRTVDTLFSAIMLLSLLLAVAGFLATPAMLRAIRTPAVQLDGAVRYLQIIFLGIPGIAGYNTLGGMIRATGNSREPLLFLLVCSVLNILLDVWAIRVLHLGLAGAAAATVAAQTVSFLLCLLYINRSSSRIHYRLHKLDICFSTLQRGLRCAVPVSIQQSAMSVGALLLQVVVNGLGPAAVTACTIGGRIDTFAALPIVNIGQALSIFTSQNLGAQKPGRAQAALRLSLLWAYGVGAVLLVVLWLFGDGMARFFGAEGITVQMTVDYVRVVSLGYFAAGYFTVVLGYIRGTGNTFAPMAITILGFWAVRLPLAALLRIPFGYLGVWCSILAGWALTCLFTFVYFKSKRFQRALAASGLGKEQAGES